jgi:Rod binding domain-containing protein
MTKAVSNVDQTVLGPPKDPKAWKAAKDFEAMALGEMLTPMFETVKSSEGIFGGGSAEDTWKPMMTQELAKQIAHSGGLGLAEPIYQQMLQMQEQANAKK